MKKYTIIKKRQTSEPLYKIKPLIFKNAGAITITAEDGIGGSYTIKTIASSIKYYIYGYYYESIDGKDYITNFKGNDLEDAIKVANKMHFKRVRPLLVKAK